MNIVINKIKEGYLVSTGQFGMEDRIACWGLSDVCAEVLAAILSNAKFQRLPIVEQLAESASAHAQLAGRLERVAKKSEKASNKKRR